MARIHNTLSYKIGGRVYDFDIPSFVNTEEFRRDALYFKKWGVYTKEEVGSREWHAYWDEQERRCINGYTVGGVKITGDHYGYLNFSEIKLTPSDKDIRAVTTEIKKSKSARKIKTFPSFLDGDYAYFHLKEIASEEGKHMIVAKARRKGYSYKNGWICTARYKYEPNSVTLVGAYDWKYLTDADAIMMMINNDIDFINQHTGWRRSKLIDRVEHQKDGYIKKIDGVDIEAGYKSQVLAVSCYQNPGALRGKDGTLIIMEEAGKWEGLLECYRQTKSSVEDGIYTTGQIIIFGTGGGDNKNWADFEEMFYDPDTHNLISFDNIWDDDANGTFCGFFHPDYVGKIGFIDEHGNSLEHQAKEYEVEKRENLEKLAKNATDSIARKMEHPFNPSEAFQILGLNMFPVEEAKAHRAKVLQNKLYEIGKRGYFKRNTEGAVEFVLDTSKVAVEYDVKKATTLKGCWVLFDMPYKMGGLVPDNLYLLSNDPYAQDNIMDNNRGSLGCTYIAMNANNIVPSRKGDTLVAVYIGRPETMDIYNEQMFLGAEYFNAKIGFENDRGDVVGYAKRFNLLNWLEPEFELGWQVNMNNKLGRSYGMSMGGGKYSTKKAHGDGLLNEWLRSVRGIDENGKQIWNLHTILDIPTLDEIIHYKAGYNFDRISSLRVMVYYMKELAYKNIKPKAGTSRSSTAKFFKTVLYNKGV
jgi:hypothetical protein